MPYKQLLFINKNHDVRKSQDTKPGYFEIHRHNAGKVHDTNLYRVSTGQAGLGQVATFASITL